MPTWSRAPFPTRKLQSFVGETPANATGTVALPQKPQGSGSLTFLLTTENSGREFLPGRWLYSIYGRMPGLPASWFNRSRYGLASFNW
jgi:hypothetical protein